MCKLSYIINLTFIKSNQIKSNQITFIVTSPQHKCLGGLILVANIIFTTENREHNKYLNKEIVHFYPLNGLISNVMPATGLKKVGNKGLKKQDILKRFSWENI